MIPAYLPKLVIVLLLLLIVFSMGRALYSLVKDKGDSERTVRALTLRVSLSIGLFILLMLAFATGLIAPNPL